MLFSYFLWGFIIEEARKCAPHKVAAFFLNFFLIFACIGCFALFKPLTSWKQTADHIVIVAAFIDLYRGNFLETYEIMRRGQDFSFCVHCATFYCLAIEKKIDWLLYEAFIVKTTKSKSFRERFFDVDMEKCFQEMQWVPTPSTLLHCPPKLSHKSLQILNSPSLNGFFTQPRKKLSENCFAAFTCWQQMPHVSPTPIKLISSINREKSIL